MSVTCPHMHPVAVKMVHATFFFELTTVTHTLEVATKQWVTTTEIGKTPATETVGHYHRNRKDPSY